MHDCVLSTQHKRAALSPSIGSQTLSQQNILDSVFYAFKCEMFKKKLSGAACCRKRNIKLKEAKKQSNRLKKYLEQNNNCSRKTQRQQETTKVLKPAAAKILEPTAAKILAIHCLWKPTAAKI